LSLLFLFQTIEKVSLDPIGEPPYRGIAIGVCTCSDELFVNGGRKVRRVERRSKSEAPPDKETERGLRGRLLEAMNLIPSEENGGAKRHAAMDTDTKTSTDRRSEQATDMPRDRDALGDGGEDPGERGATGLPDGGGAREAEDWTVSWKDSRDIGE
jgi:hypothetical protein